MAAVLGVGHAANAPASNVGLFLVAYVLVHAVRLLVVVFSSLVLLVVEKTLLVGLDWALVPPRPATKRRPRLFATTLRQARAELLSRMHTHNLFNPQMPFGSKVFCRSRSQSIDRNDH